MTFRQFNEYSAKNFEGVTLRTNGFLYIPKSVFDQIKLKLNCLTPPTHVALYIDEENTLIALKFTNIDETGNTQGMKKLIKEHGGFNFSISKILEVLNIPRMKYRKYLNISIKNNELVVINLSSLK